MSALSEQRALARARMAVAKAEVGWGQGVELEVPARPVLAELLEEGALERAILLLERDGEEARIVIAPRRHSGDVTVADLLEEEHRRLDGLGAEMCRVAQTDPGRAQRTAQLLDAGLRRHFRMEEGLLFPLFDERGGLRAAATTSLLRNQHAVVRGHLTQLTEAAGRLQDGGGGSAASDQLRAVYTSVLDTLAEHNAQEERSVSPFLDRTNRARERVSLMRLIVLF